MNFDDYEVAAARTRNGYGSMANWALGICGEAGEVAEITKKCMFHGKKYDDATDALVDELGDVLWYLAAMANCIGSSIDAVAKRNIEKLKARYPDGFVTGGGER